MLEHQTFFILNFFKLNFFTRVCPGSEREVGELAGEGADVPDDQLAVTRHRGDRRHAALRTLVDPQLRYLKYIQLLLKTEVS